jgi:ABC-2 type transport system ATP-binding protein
LCGRLSGEDNLKYYGRIYQMRNPEWSARIKEVLTFFDLWERRREPVRTWSRGMRQKLAIARALLHRPSLIFLDEPTSGLDPISAAHLREQLAPGSARGRRDVFLTTHNLARRKS